MSWILPGRSELAAMKKAVGISTDRHRPGYWREYHARNIATRRPYLTAKAREYRAAK